MMAGNPNWWIMDNGMQFAYGSTSSLSSSLLNPSPASDHHCLHPNGQEFPIRTWSQLIMGGSAINNNNEEENWEEGGQLISSSDHLKQEENFHHLIYGQYNNFDGDDDDGCNEFMRPNKQYVSDSCSRHHRPVSSPTSCVTTLSNNNILSFSFAGNSQNQKQNHLQDHLSECNSRGTGGAAKKARVAPQSALKVRKEKLGDRITTLHNLVSPFGKTDTASVLSEANGYIRFLHAQIQALSSPYMSAESATQHHHQHYSSDSSHDQLSRSSRAQDLRSRGLCLVPTSCTQPMIENDIEADYWAPAPFNFSWRHEL